MDGVLLQTAVYGAKDPHKMAVAMKHAVEAGRLAFEAGRMPKKLYGSASSPIEGRGKFVSFLATEDTQRDTEKTKNRR